MVENSGSAMHGYDGLGRLITEHPVIYWRVLCLYEGGTSRSHGDCLTDGGDAFSSATAAPAGWI